MKKVLVLSGIRHDGEEVWTFVPRDWDIAMLERWFPFDGEPGDERREAVIAVPVARDLARRYGGQPLLNMSGAADLCELLRDDLRSIRVLLARGG